MDKVHLYSLLPCSKAASYNIYLNLRSEKEKAELAICFKRGPSNSCLSSVLNSLNYLCIRLFILDSEDNCYCPVTVTVLFCLREAMGV